MSSKRKIRAKKPPLSLLDRFLYIALFVSACLLLYTVINFFTNVLPFIVSGNNELIIAVNNERVTILCSIPLIMFILIGFVCVLSCGYKSKQPIFGNKKFKPKAMEPTFRVYPIFSKEFRENLDESKKIKFKRIAKKFLVMLLISLLILTLGVFPRETLDTKNELISYNIFNIKTHNAKLEDAEKLVIDVYRAVTKNSTVWLIELKFIFEDHTYNFYPYSFYEMSREESYAYMLELKGYFHKGNCEILHKERLSKMISDVDFTQQEINLIYKLFDE